MKRKLFITAALVACFTVCLAVVGGLAGKWKGSLKDPNGDSQQFHLVFNVDGNNLTGTAQGDGEPLTIKDGKIDGNNFSFNTTDQGGNLIPVDGKYIAAGDSISLNFSLNNAKYHVTFMREDK